MEPEQSVAELTARVDALESDLGGRVALLEGQVATLSGAGHQTGATTPVIGAAGVTAPVGGAATGAGPAGPSVAPPPSGPPAAPPAPPRPEDAIPVTPPPSPIPAARTATERFEVSVEAILRWAGIGLVVLAAVFLVSTAIDRGWISRELQLLGATVIGFAVMAAGVRLLEIRRNWAQALVNGGTVIITVCAGAAYGWLDLWDPTVGLGLVAMASAFSVLLARRLSMESVAITATAAMLLVPSLASIIADAPVLVIGVWLGLFAVAAAAVGAESGWILYRTLSTWAAALWVLGLAGFLAADNNTDHLIDGSILVAVVGLVLWLGPSLATTVKAGRIPVETWRALDHRTVLAVPLWSWAAVLLFGGFEAAQPGGPIGLVMAAGFIAIAAVAGPVLGRLADRTFASHLLGAGILATISITAWLDGSVLLVALSAQALATLLVAQMFQDRWLTINGYVLAGMSWLVLASELADAIDRAEFRIGESAAHAVAVALLAAVAWIGGRGRPAVLAEAGYGFVWLALLGFSTSLLAPVVEDQAWLVVGAIMSLATLAAARWLGVWVLGIGAVVSLLSVAGGGISILDTAVNGAPAWVHLANLSVVAALTAGTALLWKNRSFDPARLALVVSWIWGLGWIASVLLTELEGSGSQVSISVIWAIAACAAIVVAIRSNDVVVRSIGLATLAVVLIKLFTVDLEEVDTLWRVGLFLVIGLGLLRLGYVLPTLAQHYGPSGSNPVAGSSSVAGSNDGD